MRSLRYILSLATITLFAGVTLPDTAVGEEEVSDVADDSATESEEENLGELYAEIELRPGISKTEYRDTLRAVLKEREWSVLLDIDRRIVATQKREAGSGGFLSTRGNEATVTMIFTGKAVNIYCVAWEVNREGERTKPALPRTSLGRLRRDLTDRLGKATGRR